MAKRPNVPCADCGTLLWTGTGSLPPGEARCLTCRRARRGPYKPRAGVCRSYASAHTRVRGVRGRAADQTCLHCDAQAEHWAYDHADPDQRTQQFPGRSGQSTYVLTYSVDPAHYLPLCAPCHSAFDRCTH